MKDINNQMFIPYPEYYPNMMGNFENRLSNLERMVKRLDTRLSRLEGTTNIYNEYNTSLPQDVYNQNTYPNAMHMM